MLTCCGTGKEPSYFGGLKLTGCADLVDAVWTWRWSLACSDCVAGAVNPEFGLPAILGFYRFVIVIYIYISWTFSLEVLWLRHALIS